MRNGIVSHTAGGALGGAMGTLFLMEGMKRANRALPEKLKPTPTRRDPGDFLVSRLERIRGRPLPRRVHEQLAGALHWLYGIGWGGLLGLSTSRRHVHTVPAALLAGAGLGAIVWAVGFAGWLPAARLTPPVHRQGGRHVAASLIAHIGYGIVSALPVLVVDRMLRREPRWRRLARAILR